MDTLEETFKDINTRINMLIDFENGRLSWENAKLALRFYKGEIKNLEQTALKPRWNEPFRVLHKTIHKQTPKKLLDVVKYDLKKNKDDIEWIRKNMHYATLVSNDGIDLIVFYEPREDYLKQIR